jgi:hypothetical protein
LKEVTIMEDTAPTATAQKFRYAMRYYIVDPFGEILWDGRGELTMNAPWPNEQTQARTHALVTAQAAQTARASAPAEAPPGRVLVAAVTPLP